MPTRSTKTLEIVQQLKFIDIESTVKILKSDSNVKMFAGCVHDKDIKTDGSPKEPHVHFVVGFENDTTPTALATLISQPPQTVSYLTAKGHDARTSALLYLTHYNSPEKHQYPRTDNDLILHNFSYELFLKKYESRLSLDKLLNSIYNGDIRRYNLSDFVSVDTYAKHRGLIENAFRLRDIDMAKKSRNRNIEITFVTGPSGAGKTTFAKRYCENKGLSYYVSASGENPLDDYNEEDVIILDDLRDSTYKFSDLLKILDPNTNSQIKARYSNKTAYFLKEIIITSVKRPEEFYTKSLEDKTESKLQFYRRASILYVVTKQDIRLFLFDTNSNNYIEKAIYPNPFTLEFKPKTLSERFEIISQQNDFLGSPTEVIYNDEDLPF